MHKDELFKLFDPENLVELSRNEIIFVRPDERIQYLNPTAKRFRGYSTKFKVTSLFLSDVYDKKSCESYRAKLTQLKHNSAVYLKLSSKNRHTQEKIYLDSRITVIYSEKQEIVCYAIVSFSITAEVLSRIELENSRNYLSSIIETANDGIIITNQKGIIQNVNPAAAQLFQYTSDELIGKNIGTLMPQPHRRRHNVYLNRYLHSENTTFIRRSREVEGVRKDGHLFPFRLSVSKIKVKDENYYAGILYDLTEQKKAEKKLRQLNRELERRVQERTEELADTVNRLLREISERKAAESALRLSEQDIKNALKKEKELSDLKSRFISTASHEFRTPLSAIKLSASIISKYNESETKEDKVEKHVDRIHSNVNTMTDILTDFLSITRLQEGTFKNKPETIDLQAFAIQRVNELDSYKKENQTIHYQHIGEKKEVELDEHLLKNIILNLISNAVKYSADNGDIYFQTKITDDEISLVVKDEGIGIPETEQKFVFDRFFRAKNAANIQGTGLGLNIVRQYVELMGGKITFESELGQGTTFYVDF